MRAFISQPTPRIHQSVSGWFNVYMGTGIRGLNVAFSDSTPSSIIVDQVYSLAMTVVFPGSFPPALNFLRQLLPVNVKVSVLRIGRMFGAPRVLTTLATVPTVIIGSTAYVNVTLPSNVTQDWLNNHVSFQVRQRFVKLGVLPLVNLPRVQVVDATPSNSTPWGFNSTAGTWGRTPYVPVLSTCFSFSGFRATLRAHCDAGDIPSSWRPFCATNCSQCAALGGAWTLGASTSYDISLASFSALANRPVEK